MSWTKVTTKNNWHHITTWAGAKQVQAGDVVRLQWPDGSESEVTLMEERTSVAYGDHGHECTAESSIPCVPVVVNGAPLSVRLVGTGCKVYVG